MPGFHSHKAVLLMYTVDYSNAIQRTMHGTYIYRVAQKSKKYKKIVLNRNKTCQ